MTGCCPVGLHLLISTLGFNTWLPTYLPTLGVKSRLGSWARWHTPVSPALQRWRQEDHELKVSLGYNWVTGQHGPHHKTNQNSKQIKQQLGGYYFCVAQVCRKYTWLHISSWYQRARKQKSGIPLNVKYQVMGGVRQDPSLPCPV